MPISRNGKTYFTNAQYRVARAYSALEYARAAKYSLVKEGNCYRLQEHDSMIFTQDGRWFWNSRGCRGGALEFMQFYEGRTLPEAVNMLASGRFCGAPPSMPFQSQSEEKKPFELPEKAPSFKRLFAYLCRTRGLSSEIIRRLIRENRLYESAEEIHNKKNGMTWVPHNAVFIGLDETGKARSAFMRGMSTYGTFKHDVEGSEVEFPFCVPGFIGAKTVAVFEAAIDAISHATLAKLSGKDYRTMDRIALDCTWAEPLMVYLQSHPTVQEIHLCLDNDAAGKTGIELIRANLIGHGYTHEHGYQVINELPPFCKDWNDYLVEFRQVLEQPDANDLSAGVTPRGPETCVLPGSVL